MDRITEIAQEALRRQFRKDLPDDSRILDTPLILKYVDAEEVTKMRERMFKGLGYLTAKNAFSTGDYDDMQKYRDTQHEAGQVDARSFDLDQYVEKIYFDNYGCDFEGNEGVHPKFNGGYKCVCGNKFRMSAKSLPEECFSCGRLTPIGKLRRDGYLKR